MSLQAELQNTRDKIIESFEQIEPKFIISNAEKVQQLHKSMEDVRESVQNSPAIVFNIIVSIAANAVTLCQGGECWTCQAIMGFQQEHDFNLRKNQAPKCYR